MRDTRIFTTNFESHFSLKMLHKSRRDFKIYSLRIPNHIFFYEITGSEAGVRAARIESRKAVQQVAVEAAVKSVREKLLSMASHGQIKLSSAWRPTALVSVIAKRSDLSDMDKIRLAAKAKMDSNLGEILPKKFSSRRDSNCEIPLPGKLQFEAEDKNVVEANEEVANTRKWSTVVFTELPDKKISNTKATTDNVNSLKKRFETASMKNNEAYVIM